MRSATGRTVLLVGLVSLCIGALAASLAWSPAAAGSPELQGREAIRGEVRQLFAAGDFAGLDRLADQFRRDRARTGSGVWKLSVFYGAIHEIARIDGTGAADWQPLAGKLRAWLKARPASPAAVIANAIMLKRFAWELRPRRFVLEASLRSEEAFVTALRRARTFLESHKAVAAADPHYYVVAADLASALGEPQDSFVALIEEGLEREPGYYQLYFSGLDYFAPVEGRDPREAARSMEAFANMAVERSRPSEGLGLYARLYWHAFAALYGEDLFAKSAVRWEQMRKGMDDVLARYPDAWNINSFAYLACLAGDRDKTRELIDRIGSLPDLTAWRARTVYDHCRAWSAAGGSPDKPASAG